MIEVKISGAYTVAREFENHDQAVEYLESVRERQRLAVAPILGPIAFLRPKSFPAWVETIKPGTFTTPQYDICPMTIKYGDHARKLTEHLKIKIEIVDLGAMMGDLI